MCARELPLSFFPKLDVGVVCTACMTGRQTTKAEEAIKKKAQTVAREMVALSYDELGDGLPKVKSLLGNVYKEFGGPVGYAQHFYWTIMELSKRKPMPAAVGQLMLAFMKLHQNVELAESAVAARELTDEQLKRETELATMKLFVESSADPDKMKVISAILAKHGYRVEEATPLQMLEHASDVFENPEEHVERFLGDIDDGSD
jgi:hypothetical protein